MTRGSLRRYDVQARYASVLALASILPFAAAAIATLQRYNSSLGQIVYGAAGYYVPAVLACILLSIVPAALGCLLGFNSAGQRRNDRQGRSWTGFFVGGAVLTFDLILLIALYMLRLEKPI